jgi:lysophospholipase L1-like esterase
MPLYNPVDLQPLPNPWRAFGHSYLNVTAGTFDQTGRTDALVRNRLQIPLSNWTNSAVNGSKVTWSGTAGNALMHGGGWTTAFHQMQINPLRTGPYSAFGGATLLLWGLNDLGHMSNTTQTRTAYKEAMRAVISRARAGVVRPHTDASIAYGAGFTSVAAVDASTLGTIRRATTTTTATITITIPADYAGEVIGLGFLGKPGTSGGTITFSGTAGLTGTFSTSNITPSAPITNSAYVAATNGHIAMVKRYTAPVTGATQTIICTVTAVDAGSPQIDFDSYWLEARAAPPVIVCNIAQIPLAGQTATYTAWTTAQPTQANRDADVASWNTALTEVQAEFDSMVQIADCASALNPVTGLFGSDNLHPNEYGAARQVDAIMDAIGRLVPTTVLGRSASMAPPAILAAADRRPHVMLGWHTGQATDGGATFITAVAGNMFAFPFVISESYDRYDTMAIKLGTAVLTASTIVQLAVYNDVDWSGYPQRQVGVWGGSGLNCGTTASATLTVSSVWEPDQGLFWLTFKVMSIGTTAANFRRLIGPEPHMPMISTTGDLSAGQAAGWQLTGQGVTSAMPSLFPAGATAVVQVPYIGLKRVAAG